LKFSQFSVFRTTQDLVWSERNVLLCSGVIALENSSGLVRTTGAVESYVVQSLNFADSVLSWNTAHEALVNFVGGGPSRK